MFSVDVWYYKDVVSGSVLFLIKAWHRNASNILLIFKGDCRFTRQQHVYRPFEESETR